ncbi:RNA polymerase II elongation factor Ell [Phymastichus coffea]|uniref:RNA polymerase II elongation factor Ell n=1 Tax=Phymastichus coffea TaxID=108790 RepID=UPI00273AD104|nr:RNA polymerase II elongation factor Ell [Phymastichus coffea]XP_058805747.1 RNA polymerase II elongation factor Ell [Phymastichus coffea]
MTSLETGVQYNLSSEGHFNSNKTLIFVKLTDSAARSIDEHLKNRNRITQKPTIQFNANGGCLFFPSIKSEHNGNYTFTLSNDQDIEGTQGGFECIQKTGPKTMDSLGSLACKMRVNANDDIFETTRHRMHAVEVNNKNKCTRVLKSNETVGKKVKVKGTVRKIVPSSTTNNTTSPKHRVVPNPVAIAPIPQPKQPASRPVSASSTARPQQGDAPRKNPEIMRRSLKERLIHILALRPYKRPELFDRIHQEGLKEQDKKLVSSVLKQVARMRSNAYHLNSGAWNEIQDDWPFYSDEERAIMKRRKPQNLTPPGSSDGSSSGSGLSPNSLRSNSPHYASPSVTAKRTSSDQATDGIPQKRQRISEYRKPDAKPDAKIDVKPDVNPVANPVANSVTNNQENSQYNLPDPTNSVPNKSRGSQQENQTHSRHSPVAYPENTVKDIVNAADLANSVQDDQQENQANDMDSNADSEQEGAADSNHNVFGDYLNTYTPILNLEQKAKYKADFFAYYKDYTQLHLQVCEISKYFIHLEAELKKTLEAGDAYEYEQTKLEIFSEYARTRNVKARFDYLHDKLGHIKQLVMDYDAKMMNHYDSNNTY